MPAGKAAQTRRSSRAAEALPLLARAHAAKTPLVFLNADETPANDLRGAALVAFADDATAPAFALDNVVFGDKHTLRSVVYFLECEGLSQMQYFRKSLADRIPAIPNAESAQLTAQLAELGSGLPDAPKAAAPPRETAGKPEKSARKRVVLADDAVEKQWSKRVAARERTVTDYCAMLHAQNAPLKPLVRQITAAWGCRIRMAELKAVQRAVQKRRGVSGGNAPGATPAEAASLTPAGGAPGNYNIPGATTGAARPASSANNGASATQPRSKASLPAIVIPTAPKSLLNVYNAKAFLEGRDFALRPAEQYAAAGEAAPSLSDVTVHRRLDGGTRVRSYRLVFLPQQITDWSKVVAVFASGDPWQFETYKWRDPAILFDNVCGFHLKEFRSPTPAYITGLNVQILELHSGMNKHQNPAMLKKKFWETLDKWMAAKGRQFDQ